jgi:lipoate-protein ligase A
MGRALSIWRLICDDGVSAAAGLAVDEALMLHYGRGEAAPCEATMRLYTYAPHCALVGRYQSLADEVDLDACRRLGAQVCRRPTGGGAIIMGPAQLGVAVTTRAPAGLGPRELLRRYAGGIIAGLASLGVSAEFCGKNDLRVDGRKIAGLGLYVDPAGALLFHASVLADLDVSLMLQLLRIPGAKLAGSGMRRADGFGAQPTDGFGVREADEVGVRRVAERVTTVGGQLGRPMSGADLRTAICEGFTALLGVSFARSSLDAAEARRARELEASRYGSEQWLAQRDPAAGGRHGTALLRTPGGLLRIYAGVQGGALSSVMITGDFSAAPQRLLALEAALRWCRADERRISQLVAEQLDGELLGAAAEQVAQAIWEAAQRALLRSEAAAPVRAQGSCYFPEREDSEFVPQEVSV